MELLHHTNRPVAEQVSAPVAARLQQSSSGLAILLAFLSAGLFWAANFLGAVPAWAWAIPALSSVATVGFWLFVPSDRLLKSGSLLSLAILSASLGALAQPNELKVFFAGFFALWLVNLTFFRLFSPRLFWRLGFLGHRRFAFGFGPLFFAAPLERRNSAPLRRRLFGVHGHPALSLGPTFDLQATRRRRNFSGRHDLSFGNLSGFRVMADSQHGGATAL